VRREIHHDTRELCSGGGPRYPSTPEIRSETVVCRAEETEFGVKARRNWRGHAQTLVTPGVSVAAASSPPFHRWRLDHVQLSARVVAPDGRLSNKRTLYRLRPSSASIARPLARSFPRLASDAARRASGVEASRAWLIGSRPSSAACLRLVVVLSAELGPLHDELLESPKRWEFKKKRTQQRTLAASQSMTSDSFWTSDGPADLG
jgi:hypothetical protein